MNWFKEESDKLIKFINEAPDSELDKLLKESNFGALVDCKPDFPFPMRLLFDSDYNYIQTVLSHKDEEGKVLFPTKPFYWATNKQAKDAVFYVKDGEVRSDFVNSDDKAMYWYFYFVQASGFNPYLIAGAKFA